MQDEIEGLKKLHTTLIDTCRGYEEALKDGQDNSLLPLFREMVELRQHDHREIHSALVRKGETPDENGSFMSIVHKTVIDVRSAITGLDQNSLPSFVSGEESVIGVYNNVLKECSADPEISQLLLRQKQQLENKIAKMKAMQPA